MGPTVAVSGRARTRFRSPSPDKSASAREPRRRPYGRATYDGPVSDTDIPADLLELQRRWYEAEADWAADPTEDKRSVFAAVGAELYAHPYWATVDNRHKATMKLKQAARPDAPQAPAA